MNFEDSLRTALQGAVKTVIVGIGNELNGDDGFGIRVAERIHQSEKSISILAHTVPENFISVIAAEKPSHVLFLDSAFLDASPGTLSLLGTEDLARIATVTHRIPLSKIIERLVGLHQCQILIIGLQPKNMDVGSGLSPEVRETADELVDLLNNIFSI